MVEKHDRNIEEIIIKHLDKSSTVDEEKILFDWINEKTENRKTFSEVSDLWNVSKIHLSDNDIENALMRFRGRTNNMKPRKKKKKTSLLHKLTQAAALLLILFNAFYFLYYETDKVDPVPVTINRLLTSENSKGKFILPDSTIVWLNANSMLEYPEHFSDKRKVRLRGEAYFEVSRNESSPFLVTASDMSIEVLGTSFLVQNYENKSYAEAVLTEGSIKLNGQKIDNVIMIPNQRIAYMKNDKRLVIENVKTHNYTSWMKDKIEFDNTNLADIIINIEKWYGVEIECDARFAKSINLSFVVYRESLDEILFAIKHIAPIDYTIKEKKITFKKR